MKLINGLLSTLVGSAATAGATQPPAEIFFLPALDASSPLAVSPSLVRLLLLQRLSSQGRGSSWHDIRSENGIGEAVSLLNRYGKATAPLFSNEDINLPNQLVLMLDNMNEPQMETLRQNIGMSPALRISDPPSSMAHKDLVEFDLRKTGASDGNACSIQQITNPMEECWNDRHSSVARYSVDEDPEIVSQIVRQIKQLVQLAKSGDMQTIIVALPLTKNSNKWSGQSHELRRRQSEQIMSALDRPEALPKTTPAASSPVLYASTGRIPSCFDSLSACSEGTRNCSGHGECKNKYATGDDDNGKAVCFSCHCQATRGQSGSLTHWGGASCAKQDVSTPFWLFAGFTVGMIGILSMSIGLLFNVGEEKLPGVIGAGVSRSK